MYFIQCMSLAFLHHRKSVHKTKYVQPEEQLLPLWLEVPIQGQCFSEFC